MSTNTLNAKELSDYRDQWKAENDPIHRQLLKQQIQADHDKAAKKDSTRASKTTKDSLYWVVRSMMFSGPVVLGLLVWGLLELTGALGLIGDLLGSSGLSDFLWYSGLFFIGGGCMIAFAAFIVAVFFTGLENGQVSESDSFTGGFGLILIAIGLCCLLLVIPAWLLEWLFS
ncbi:hypothetical protein OAH22_01160 [bacterium]|nr:hypothetical protein [bacterium]